VERLSRLVKRTPPVVLLMVAMLAVCVGYSLYRAATAFSPKPASPAYERMPSQAFAIPQAIVLVDPQKLTEPRLPDTAYEQIVPTARRLGAAFRSGELGARKLEGAGLGRKLARKRADEIAMSAKALRGREVRSDEEVSVQVESPTRASARLTYEILSTSLGASSLTLVLGFSERRPGVWRLYDTRVEG